MVVLKKFEKCNHPAGHGWTSEAAARQGGATFPSIYKTKGAWDKYVLTAWGVSSLDYFSNKEAPYYDEIWVWVWEDESNEFGPVSL